jgi:hypothetical protein
MGCCGSKEDDERPTGGRSKPSERTPLLKDVPPLPADDYGAQREARDKAHAEREALKEVVKRASDNLININSTESAAKIHGQDAAERAENFKKMISGAQIKRPNGLPKPSKSIDPSSIATILVTGVISSEDKEKITQQLNALYNALKTLKVQDVGPIVQTLPDM